MYDTIYPFLSHRACHSLTLSRSPLCSCMKRTSSAFVCAYFSNFLILFIPSAFPFRPLTLKVAILSLSGPSPGYPSVLSIFFRFFLFPPLPVFPYFYLSKRSLSIVVLFSFYLSLCFFFHLFHIEDRHFLSLGYFSRMSHCAIAKGRAAQNKRTHPKGEGVRGHLLRAH